MNYDFGRKAILVIDNIPFLQIIVLAHSCRKGSGFVAAHQPYQQGHCPQAQHNPYEGIGGFPLSNHPPPQLYKVLLCHYQPVPLRAVDIFISH